MTKGLYLEKRRQRWYINYKYPANMAAVLGKPKFVKSMETDSRAEAELRARPIMAELLQLRSLIDQGRFDEAEAIRFRRDLTNTKTDQEDEAVRTIISQRLEEIHESGKRLSNSKDVTTTTPRAIAMADIAFGRKTPSDLHLEAYLKTRTSDLTPKTINMYRTDIERFTSKFAYIEDITRREAHKYLDDLCESLSPKNLDRTIPAINGYWNWMTSRDYIDNQSSPLSGYKRPKKNNKKGAKDGTNYLPWNEHEIKKLEEAIFIKKDYPLLALVRIGKHTGARIDELMNVEVQDVETHGNRLLIHIRDSKTQSGIREVPIHTDIHDLVCDLRDQSKDGYLIPIRATKNKYGSRSDAIGKRFGRVKRELGFQTRRQAFHSFRATFITAMKRLGVDRLITQDMVGHDDGTVTGVYEHLSTREQMFDAVDRLSFPIADIDQY